jgi:hypothetical protein
MQNKAIQVKISIEEQKLALEQEEFDKMEMEPTDEFDQDFFNKNPGIVKS